MFYGFTDGSEYTSVTFCIGRLKAPENVTHVGAKPVVNGSFDWTVDYNIDTADKERALDIAKQLLAKDHPHKSVRWTTVD